MINVDHDQPGSLDKKSIKWLDTKFFSFFITKDETQ